MSAVSRDIQQTESMKELLTMSKQERSSLEVLSRIRRKELRRSSAASILDVSERQVYRLLVRTASEGASGLVHGLRGHPSNRRHALWQRNEVIAFTSSGSIAAAGVSGLWHSVIYGDPWVRPWDPRQPGDRSAVVEGGWAMGRLSRTTASPEASRATGSVRERREGIGTLVQFDGSPHDWFEGRGPAWVAGSASCLLVAIDDCSSRVFDCSSRVFMRFAPSEDTEHVMRTLWAYMERYGIPQALYTDHGSVYGSFQPDLQW